MKQSYLKGRKERDFGGKNVSNCTKSTPAVAKNLRNGTFKHLSWFCVTRLSCVVGALLHALVGALKGNQALGSWLAGVEGG